MTKEEADTVMASRRAARLTNDEAKLIRDMAVRKYYGVAIGSDYSAIVIYKPSPAKNLIVAEFIQRMKMVD